MQVTDRDDIARELRETRRALYSIPNDLQTPKLILKELQTINRYFRIAGWVAFACAVAALFLYS